MSEAGSRILLALEHGNSIKVDYDNRSRSTTAQLSITVEMTDGGNPVALFNGEIEARLASVLREDFVLTPEGATVKCEGGGREDADMARSYRILGTITLEDLRPVLLADVDLATLVGDITHAVYFAQRR